MDALDWTDIPGCNAAWTSALTTIEEMVKAEENWQGLTDKFKLCSLLNGEKVNDVRSMMELLIDNLAGVVQYNGRSDIQSKTDCYVMGMS